MQKLLYAHGGRDLSDAYLQVRQITMEGTLYADTLALFETAKRALAQAVLKGGRLSISNDTVTRFIGVRLLDYDPDMEYQTLDNVSISFVAEYPFWQDTTETEQVEVVAGNTSFVVDTTGADDIMLPEIEIDADQAADIPGVKMYNYNDGGLAFEYNDPQFYINDILIINSYNGTVMKNGNPSMLYFNPPYFIRLQPGTNTIYYEGAAATIKIRYRKVYM
jgi:phage-related protein